MSSKFRLVITVLLGCLVIFMVESCTTHGIRYEDQKRKIEVEGADQSHPSTNLTTP